MLAYRHFSKLKLTSATFDALPGDAQLCTGLQHSMQAGRVFSRTTLPQAHSAMHAARQAAAACVRYRHRPKGAHVLPNAGCGVGLLGPCCFVLVHAAQLCVNKVSLRSTLLPIMVQRMCVQANGGARLCLSHSVARFVNFADTLRSTPVIPDGDERLCGDLACLHRHADLLPSIS